jgi:hypothetical protein
LAIVQNIVAMISIDVINLCGDHAHWYQIVINGTVPTQMCILIATSTCNERRDSQSIRQGTIAGLLTTTTHRPISLLSLFVGAAVGHWGIASVIDAGWYGFVGKQHDILSVAVIS